MTGGGIKHQTIAAFAVLLLCSCQGVGGFWTRYHEEAIIGRKSDQGPWGGERWILWHAGPGTFVPADAITFAASHGWRCDAPVAYRRDQLRAWVFEGKPVFPLLYEGSNNRGIADFPRRIQSDSYVIRCATGWIRVDPGTGRESTAYGYIHVSTDGQDLAVYHLWGEA